MIRAAIWWLALALGDAAVIIHSTTHNPLATTLAIGAGLLIADVVATFVVVFFSATVDADG